MVNGPRPTLVIVPPTAAGPRTPSTPQVLTRQATSMYSLASTATPVLVYGKAITPLAAQWADEPWSPKERVEPVTLLDILDHPISADPALTGDMGEPEETASSIAETAVPPPHQPVVHQPQQQQEAAAATSLGHVSFVFRYDPYTFSLPRTEMYRCTCTDCMDRSNAVPLDAQASAGVSPMSWQVDPMMEMPTSTSYDHYTYSEEAYGGQPISEHAAEEYWNAPRDVPRTAFIPPPPAPIITRRVIAESAEASLDAESAYYLIVMRWYRKVAAVQDQWLPAEDFCPPPAADYGMKSFDAWIAEVGKWWLRHFEHVQVKTSASSGALRGAPAPVVQQPQPHPRGFESHASRHHHVAPNQAAPRRQFGASGLTEAMLASHNQVVPPQPHAARPRRELPW